LQNRFQEALADYEHALTLEPRNFEAWMGRGAMLVELVRGTEALACFQDARAFSTHDADKLQRLGLAFLDLDATEAAYDCFKSALAIRPDDAETHNNLGVALGELGNLKGAEACYREALRLKPDHAGAWHNLVSIIHLKPEGRLWQSLMASADAIQSRAAGDAILLHFSLGKIWEDAGEYARAFSCFLEGNRLERAGLNYDEARQARFFHDSMHYFDSAFMAAHNGAGSDGESPVFIIGMPRSGTTLVEQILASHSQVYGAGELHLLRQCLRLELGPVASEDQLPQRLALLNDKHFQRAGERYLAATRELAPGAWRITDKLPGNMVLVGLIHLMFPRAHIIHCTRDALDTCVSCFSQHFSTGYPFSYDLGELGRFYRWYAELMNHWRAVLPPGRMLEVRYEDVVTDVAEQAQKLVAFCGLPWDASCLQFYASSRPVKTASLAQVRQPIYGSSVGRWKRYEKYLDPLMQALAGK
ncbi:MAG: sulfotransferase, partial [Gammaproteobacteria bacterium]